MTYQLSWLAADLRNAGLKVAEVPGWETRGHTDMGPVHGLLMHHTAGPRSGNMPSLGVVTHGRPDLSGPLCNLGLGRDGTFYCVAAGLAYHAGPGNWRGVTAGNSQLIGVECENAGVNDPWPDVQLDSFRHGVAAIFSRLRLDVSMCAGHKEYCLPHGRKIDPAGVDMVRMRYDIGAIMGGTAPLPALIPASDGSNRPTLRRGSTDASVKTIQKIVGVAQDGEFGGTTEAALRVFQSKHGLVPDGIVGPRTWAALVQ